jgi:hypothetical protein
MHPLGAIYFASPKGAIGIRNIGDPCAVARKIQIARRQTREVREKFASLYVVLFSARLVTLDKQLSAIATWNRTTEVQWPRCELYTGSYSNRHEVIPRAFSGPAKTIER